MSSQEKWMADALRLARKGLYSTDPNPRVGCIIVKAGEKIAEGWHEFSGGPHAEVVAISSALIPQGCDFYVTLEPCSHFAKTPPCVDAVIACKPARVIIAMQDPNPQVCGRGIEKLRDNGIEVVCGVLEKEARMLNRGFVKRMERERPWLRVKMAASLDGRTALKNGKSAWISGEAARRDVQFLRAASSAILTSAATVLADNPSLNVRLSRDDLGQQREPRQPLRVILDSKLQLLGNEAIFDQQGKILVYTLKNDPARESLLEQAGAEVIHFEQSDQGHLNLDSVLHDLAQRGANEIHSECGPRLAGALIQQGLADECVLYLAPQLLGNLSKGLFELSEFTEMDQTIRCAITDVRSFGDDLRLTINPGVE